MGKSDNLKLMTILLTGVFLLLAIRTSYLDYAENMASSGDGLVCVLNGLGLFMMFEAPYILITYVVAPMIADAMPGMWKAGEKLAFRLRLCYLTLGIISKFGMKKSVGQQKSKSSLVDLSEEIRNYISETFKNLLTPEQLEKLLNNFRKLNKGVGFEVVEKIARDGVLPFDLAHFGWNVGKRIYDSKSCPLIFTIATAQLLKDSFPLTLMEYDIKTLKSRLRDQQPTTPFQLPIIELNEKLVPHQWK